MFTVCPKCALTLVVTAADLRVAQGYVRCGRCSNVFNAIVGLDDRQQAAVNPGGAQSPPPSTATTTIMRKAPSIPDEEAPPEPVSRPDATEVLYVEPEPVRFHDDFVEPEDFVEPTPPPPPRKAVPPAKAPAPPVTVARSNPVGTGGTSTRLPKPALPPPPPPPTPAAPPPDDDADSIPDSSLEFNPAATDVTKVFIEAPPAKRFDWKREATGTFETVVLKSEPLEEPEPPSAPPPRARDPEDVQIENDLRSLAAKLDATGNQPAPRALGPNEVTRQARGSPYNSADDPGNVALKAVKRALVDEEGATTAAEEFNPPPAPRGRKAAWIGGSLALGVVLVAQAIHHNRHDLATNATLNRPLTRLYAAIGVPLVPRWDLTSYEVRQLGATTSEGDTGNLTVRASLKNSAPQALPLPLLRITVQDRYGNRIATRDVPPTGYVPGAVPNGAHLGVGQRIDAEMTFKDPGRDAVGFEIDACLPTPGGGIACANDAPAAR